LVLDLVTADPAPVECAQARFREYGGRIAAALRDTGGDARVGEVPGEYCPGAHSVNARGQVKLVGTAQRIVRHAWMFSAVVILHDADVIRPLFAGVYRCLGLPLDTASVGSVRAEAPNVAVDDLEHALVIASGGTDPLDPGAFDPDTIEQAERLLPDHRV
jgi:hypothetical protein